MKSHFGEVKINTNRAWTEQGIYGAGKTIGTILFDDMENANGSVILEQNQMIRNILEKVRNYKNE